MDARVRMSFRASVAPRSFRASVASRGICTSPGRDRSAATRPFSIHDASRTTWGQHSAVVAERPFSVLPKLRGSACAAVHRATTTATAFHAEPRSRGDAENGLPGRDGDAVRSSSSSTTRIENFWVGIQPFLAPRSCSVPRLRVPPHLGVKSRCATTPVRAAVARGAPLPGRSRFLICPLRGHPRAARCARNDGALDSRCALRWERLGARLAKTDAQRSFGGM